MATGLSIGAEIALRGFTTLVLEGPGCHSICAVIWVSGVRRYMGPRADISVHAAYELVKKEDGTVFAPVSGAANASIGAYLNEVGLSREAIEYFTTARPDETLLPITPEIAQVLDIEVYLQDGSETSPPSDRPTPSQLVEVMTDYMVLMTQCNELIEADQGFLDAQSKAAVKVAYDTFDERLIARLFSHQVQTAKVQMSEEGQVRFCLRTEENLRAHGKNTGITGPSFDCGLAASETETAICSSRDLWTLDRVMSRVYFYYKRMANGAQASAFLNTQRSWLTRRDECGGDVACLRERYSSRLFDFGF
ncbi:hypothetical protein ACFP8Z_02535 [Gemmobacter lanyuensis]|uniref:hypothetical protein n=1 Tax=Gemmobacter lanyuensis TaxID=1054497 RepID=UPI00361214D5